LSLRDRGRLHIAVAAVSLWALASLAAADNPHARPGADASLSPEKALERLRAGNEAFRKGYVATEHLTPERRMALYNGQRPFAIVLSCSDSRVPPEQVFAQGLGDLFTVRVAGNIADPATVASIEYAAAHLGTQLLVVMGHTQCGAVKAALTKASDTPAIKELVAAIRPAIESVPPEAVDQAVAANVRYVREQLVRASALLAGLVREGKLKVVEGVYDLATGEVKLTETP
jgi:carbonic anhydrase